MIEIAPPELQITFAARLAAVRHLYLQDALGETVQTLNVPDIDRELAVHVPAHSLTTLAGYGLRDELMFPVPIVLAANPRLLGYYRLLYGYSQKEFYTATSGLAGFKGMEQNGVASAVNVANLPLLCSSMCRAGELLLAGLGAPRFGAALLDDLTLLTLGPQLRGGANVRKGMAGIQVVFNSIREIVQSSIVLSSSARMQLLNAAGRTVYIEFAPDPDIIIREEMRPENFRKLIAIEVKAGSDFSNIHNRIGEAEKSHQKAKTNGYVECWTVVNVDKIDLRMAHRESPSTNRFYRVSDLIAKAGEEYRDFTDRITSLTGISGR